MERGAGRGGVFGDVTGLVGNTPVVKISERLAPKGVEVYAKCEFANPLSSVKDRLAVAIIEDAEKKGLLKPGDTVVEATSGNTGIAIAMVCAQRGYNCVLLMAESFSIERRKIMRMLGAKVIVTPKAGKGTGMVRKMEELCEKHGWFMCHQFETEANWKFHEKTTGPEIINDFQKAGKSLTHWVTGYGTGGTFHGTGIALKKALPDIKIVLAEPEQAPLLASGVKTQRNDYGGPVESHPAFTSHPIQGWAPDFVPLVLEQAPFEPDDLIPIPGPMAMEVAKALAKYEGILTGISGGATMYAALETAKNAPPGSVICCMLPDTGERYLSTPLYSDIQADMNDEELDIAKSTPSFQLLPGQPPVLYVPKSSS